MATLEVLPNANENQGDGGEDGRQWLRQIPASGRRVVDPRRLGLIPLPQPLGRATNDESLLDESLLVIQVYFRPVRAPRRRGREFAGSIVSRNDLTPEKLWTNP